MGRWQNICHVHNTYNKKATCEVKVNKYLYITVRGRAFHGQTSFFNDITQLDNLQLIKLNRRSKVEIKDAKATHNCSI